MTRRDWFNTMEPTIAAKAIANNNEEQLNTVKGSLYDSLCDEDGFDFDKTPEGEEYWSNVTDKIWEEHVAHRTKNN